MKSVLVHNGRHQRPMLAVLERYGLGNEDKYDRGRWISISDIDKISEKIQSDPTNYCGYVYGTNRHNSVHINDFIKLFN